jgi:hypothetical protein
LVGVIRHDAALRIGEVALHPTDEDLSAGIPVWRPALHWRWLHQFEGRSFGVHLPWFCLKGSRREKTAAGKR